MLFWRALVSGISMSLVLTLLVFFINFQILAITSVESLDDTPKNIPPADTIIPNLQKAADATPSNSDNSNNTSIADTSKVDSTVSVPGTSGVAIHAQMTLSAQQRVAYAKYCRDIICAFQYFQADFNNGNSCMCIQRNPKF
ncbi:1210_t:CDS:2 [Ambispora gerdemannii]|uniref:1210_t:CDS:1 n=1 Tax=Ambispora gerdemannii TaxID=144530 RepID=A0A9N9CBA7_9GLOM|nr:1210_t:CDS:2 [Ambispora gerdemannii]